MEMDCHPTGGPGLIPEPLDYVGEYLNICVK